ncbi:MAG: DUF4230 domain-containing protein [Prevotella sp.]|nr:DUF4230 domain-containing protein [Prevotella sp.]
MKRILAFTAMLVLLASSCHRESRKLDSDLPVDTIPMMVMQIQKCSKLYTAEYHLHKIVTHKDQMRLKGTILAQKFDITLPVGNRRIAIPMDATLKAYIDFNGFSEKNIRRRGEKIEVTLPDPKVELTSSRINHQEIKKQLSILRKNFSDEEMTNYEKQGRAAILNEIPNLGIIEMARESAANTLIPMICQLGYKEEDITITFRKKYTSDDFPILLDTKSFGK